MPQSAKKRVKGPRCVVAIAGSAGALEAFERFFSNVPEKLGVAFVVLQHMDPVQKSYLPELLARTTEIPISAIKGGEKLEADHIYTLSPGEALVLENGHFVTRKFEN